MVSGRATFANLTENLAAQSMTDRRAWLARRPRASGAPPGIRFSAAKYLFRASSSWFTLKARMRAQSKLLRKSNPLAKSHRGFRNPSRRERALRTFQQLIRIDRLLTPFGARLPVK
jgi:hypothetical protein